MTGAPPRLDPHKLLAGGTQSSARHDADLPLRNVAGLGRRSRLLLQRRLHPNARRETPKRAWTAAAGGVEGNLRRARGPLPLGYARRRSDLGQGAVVAARAQ